MNADTDARELPIIFNAWSIGRIFDDAKTQTRRIMKPQPPDNADRVRVEEDGTLGFFAGETAAFHSDQQCPYGTKGDILWVRESFRLPLEHDDLSPKQYLEGIGNPHTNRYAAMRYECGKREVYDRSMYTTNEDDAYDIEGVDFLRWGRLRPSIHMPKELCRLRLRNEGVRAQRIQEISSADCIAEGIPPDTSEWGTALPFDDVVLHHANGEQSAREGYPIEKDALATLWSTIHGQGAWSRNDWVFAVTFSRLTNHT